MPGWRSVFPAFLIGSGLACADATDPLALPDSAFVPVLAVDGQRLQAGRYVYQTVMWTDNLVESPQREERITLFAGAFRDRPAWEARSEIEHRWVGGRYVQHRGQRVWFGRDDLTPLRLDGLRQDGSAGFEIDFTADSVVQRWGSEGRWLRNSRARAGGVYFLAFSYAHGMAVLATLPLSEGWAGKLGDRRIAVVAQEEITVPAGTFSCWRLEAAELPEGQDELPWRRREWRAWVSVDRPLVIRTETGPVAERWETRLVSFDPAR